MSFIEFVRIVRLIDEATGKFDEDAQRLFDFLKELWFRIPAEP